MSNVKGRNALKKIITVAPFVILAVALAATYVLPDGDMLSKANEVLPQADYFKKVSSNPQIFEGIAQENGQITKVGYVVISEANGYGGPITMITAIDLDGNIKDTIIADHKDTPTFIHMIKSHQFLDQFLGKKVNAPLRIGEDIDKVSGATFSSKGIARAISRGSHAVAVNQFGLEVPQENQEFNFGFKDAVVSGLILLMIIGIKFRINRLRWVTLIASLIFIGFKFNAAVSMGTIASILMGYFPPIGEHIFWYLWFLGIPVITFILSKNVYCFWLCPFGAAQEITAKIGGGRTKCHKDIEFKLRKIKYVLAFVALLMAFIWKSPGLASYEPFATLFALQGFGVQWFILPIVLFSSLFIGRFWCRYFCPVWVANEITWKLRKTINKCLKGAKQWNKEKSAAKS
ncbi:MAG: 4Fe-4S binding protein [Thermoanaerobacteraceae bacterium]|nr:4Fe-4S binding protein [Thermoanaerobacteraceae bacterium]